MSTILSGDYLELRPLPEADLPKLHKVYQGTPLYFDAIGQDVNRLQLAQVRAQWEAAQTDSHILFGAYHIVTGLLIGAVDVQIGVPNTDAAAFWLLIWGGFQRQGYGQEAVALVINWLIAQHPEVAELYAIAADNDEGQSFLQLQGFIPTGEPAPSPIADGPVFWMRRAGAEG